MNENLLTLYLQLTFTSLANIYLTKLSLYFLRLNSKTKKVRKLNIKYEDIQIKQHSKVKHLGCILNETKPGETMALSVINKINNNLKFLYWKNWFLTPTLGRLLCNALIQPHFDYACSAWYPNLTKKLNNRIQTS